MRHLLLGFTIIVVLVAAEFLLDFYHADELQERIELIVDTHNNKVRRVHDLRNIVRERVITLNTMLIEPDPFRVEELYIDFLNLGNRYVLKRRELESHIEHDDEHRRLVRLRALTVEGTPIIETAVELARKGEQAAATQLLLEQVMPLQERVMAQSDLLVDYYTGLVSKQSQDAQQVQHGWRENVVWLGGGVLVMILAIAIYVLRRISSDRRVLLHEIDERIEIEQDLQNARDTLERAVELRTRELREKSELLSEAQKISRLGHWEWIVPTGALRWSDEIFRMFGVDAEQIEPSYELFLESVHPDDRDEVVAAVEAAVAGTADYSIDHRILQPDGQVRMVHERGVVYRDSAGLALRMLGTVLDITERKAMEERLRFSASVFQNAGDGVMISDRNNRILDVNEAFTRITGYELEDVLGEDPKILQSGQHDNAFYQLLWSNLETHGEWQGEIWDRNKEGEVIPLNMTINVVKDERDRLSNYVALFRDISAAKANEQSLWHDAHHDALTDLPNRSLLYARLQMAVAQSDRNKEPMAVLLIDLDGFKEVNDTLDHDAGDDLLVHVARMLKGSVRENDTVARYAGDEFVVILQGGAGREVVERLAISMLKAISSPVTGSRYFCESLFWASKPKQTAKT
ncbi:diguanylate cyclase domain-containing protein [Candidatus Reidiella endopervernicosa]|uniref:Diguanylate cyclase n=1 Tax=Candidatus Reidiella endopervernicosa TaxID=2738883 RepID=A0A6N0HRP9_9GAMM|nr:diguanylate cyclase [Candidatus Reidiella endopervernicosa]QKQ25033.1 diguanylate cyclase [Candidatus Reidiella endopervernicosa]